MITVKKAADGKLKQHISNGRNQIFWDEPEVNGGDDAGLAPPELLDASLGSCTALTVTLVALPKENTPTRVQGGPTGHRLVRDLHVHIGQGHLLAARDQRHRQCGAAT